MLNMPKFLDSFNTVNFELFYLCILMVMLFALHETKKILS